MSTTAALVLGAIVAYGAVGIATALAFVSFGVVRVLPRPVPVSLGARILLIPGAAALWPCVLRRWLTSPRRP